MNKNVPAITQAPCQDHEDQIALRAQRIRELRATALAKECSLRANIQAEAANLQETTQVLYRAIKETLTDGPDVLRKLAQIKPVLDEYHCHIKLAINLLELDHRIEKSRNG